MTNYSLMTYNDTRDLFTIVKWTNNTASSGLLFPIILAALWFILFIGSLSEARQASRAWTFASFICAILGILLALMSFLDSKWVYLLVLMTAGGLFWMRLEGSRE